MSDDTPLLAPQSNDDGDYSSREHSRSYLHRARALTQRFFASRAKHWVILTLIILDVAGILADIFIALVTCELRREHEAWVAPTRQFLKTFSLVMSCVFMLELGFSSVADGFGLFRNWFHCLDSFVIVVSFAVDLLEHGVAEDIASLIVVLRLWRFIKVVQEISVEQSEQTEALYRRIAELEKQVEDLEAGTSSGYGSQVLIEGLENQEERG
ncbi:hypothetical protein F5Y17DRAFT_429491 [Xylariaceae sp. FL0594]|nr:hypothetical protein F5Y17DRAFT_429491 [Xylariaceae sp. FL0594]